MSVRTYCPSVRVGNWNEDIQLEEDQLKDFLKRKERGELLFQKSASFKTTINQNVTLSISRDKRVHYGDVVMIVNPCGYALTSSGAATTSMSPSASTAFMITSVSGDRKGDSLTYGTPFALQLAASDPPVYLHSERATFQKCAKKSRHCQVTLVPEMSSQTCWKVEAFNPQFRMEMESMPVSANEKVIIAHQNTNQDLCVEYEHSIRGETEVSCHTLLDSHRAEMPCNHWCFQMVVPGDNA